MKELLILNETVNYEFYCLAVFWDRLCYINSEQ